MISSERDNKGTKRCQGTGLHELHCLRERERESHCRGTRGQSELVDHLPQVEKKEGGGGVGTLLYSKKKGEGGQGGGP